MTDGLDHVFTEYIRTDARSLWRAITDGDVTPTWFHGLRVVSDWREGSPVSFLPADDAQGRAHAVGEILKVREPEDLVYSFRLTAYDDPSTRVRVSSESEGEVIRLRVTHVGFTERNATWHQTAAGWPRALSSLKSLLETGEALPVRRARDGEARG